MVAFLAVAGSYLGLVRGARPPRGARQRLIAAAVLAYASVPVALAFRDWLWWTVGSIEAHTDLQTLTNLLVIVAAATFALGIGRRNAGADP